MGESVNKNDAQLRSPPHLGSAVLSIDLDHALLRTNPMHERLFIALKAQPLVVLSLTMALLRGREHFREALVRATDASFRISSCPREPKVEHLVDGARQQGKTIEWLSREPLRLDDEEPEFKRIFEGNAGILDAAESSEARADELRQRHPEGFAHVGTRAADLPLWRAASERYGVNLTESVRRQAQREGLGIVEIVHRKAILPGLLRSMRPHQWLKNMLVFVPFALSLGQIHKVQAAVAVLAFLCLCLLTSGTYLINDLFDVEADRRHPRKRTRPIASGEVRIPIAVAASFLLIATALCLAGALSRPFALALACYLLITLAYSFRLKRMAMLDVLVIASLFTLRILAGMLLVGEKPSHWLLMFSIFFFLSLAFMKREVEFNVMHQAGRRSLQGRGYGLDDRLYVMCCGLSSGMAGIVIFSLFITETLDKTSANYGSPVLLWGIMALLSYWILRMWLLTSRGLMNDDPILFAARDRTSMLLGAASAILIVCAQIVRL